LNKCPKCDTTDMKYAHGKLHCMNTDCCYKKVWCLSELWDNYPHENEFVEYFCNYTREYGIPHKIFLDCLECNMLPNKPLSGIRNLIIANNL
jgi:hypothetical protein